jgi:hypothetical protein
MSEKRWSDSCRMSERVMSVHTKEKLHPHVGEKITKLALQYYASLLPEFQPDNICIVQSTCFQDDTDLL